MDDDQIEKLLKGELDPTSLTGSLSGIAHLVAIAKAPAVSNELAGQEETISTFKAVLAGGSPATITGARNREVRSRYLSAKLIGIALATTALSGTALAAYDGQLPSSIQSTLSTGLAKVGVSIPRSDTAKSANNALTSLSSNTTSTTGGSTTTTSGSIADSTNGLDSGLSSGKSLYGLCIAYDQATGVISGSASMSATTSTTVAPSTSSTISVSPSSAEFQRLESYASQNSESVAKLCSNATSQSHSSTISNDNNRPSSNSSSSAKSHSQAASNSKSHYPFSTTTNPNAISNSLNESTGVSNSSGKTDSNYGPSNGSSHNNQGLAHKPF